MPTTRVLFRVARPAACLAGLLLCAACLQEARQPQPLREVYEPAFSAVPPREPAIVTFRHIVDGWRGPTGAMVRRDLRSWQGAALAISLLVVLSVGRSRRDPQGSRLGDLLVLWAAGALLFDSMRFLEWRRLADPTALNLVDWVFTAVVWMGLLLAARAFWLARHPPSTEWSPALRRPLLAAAATALLAANLVLVFTRPPDDAGEFVNLGAQRLRERGRLPYGDPLLTGTPGAAYGPLLYASHLPFQVLVSPAPVNERSPALPRLGPDSTYLAPPLLATQLSTAAFHLAGVLALFVVARRWGGGDRAWAIAALYCGSLAVLGIGGSPYAVAGITFVSHIAPAAMTLLALAAVSRPVLAAVLLVAAAGVGFYPAFMWPAWLGHYWRDRRARTAFVLSSGLAAALLAAAVVGLSRPAGDMTRVETILHDTFGHHTKRGGYGHSPFGFWGQREGLRKVLNTPLAGSGLTSPAWLAFAAMAAAAFVVTRGRGVRELALMSGVVALGSALVKPHATGTYLAWYYGLMLLGLLLPSRTGTSPGEQPVPKTA